MSGVQLLAGLCLAALAVAVSGLDRDVVAVLVAEAQAQPDAAFATWMQKHDKSYADEAEYQKRFEIWKDNVAYIKEYNGKHNSHWLGLNSLADISLEEFQQYPKGFDYAAAQRLEAEKKALLRDTPFRYKDTDLSKVPKSLDWREKGAVTPVKNQQQCGSCWAFSTTGSIEGANFLKTGVLEVVSEQELVDCDHEHDMGCSGGLMDYAFQFVIDNGGIDTEKDYPYNAVQNQCDLKKEHRHVVTIDGYEDVPRMSEPDLLRAVVHQPVSIAVQANERAFQLYNGGIVTADCGTSLDHGVLVVGYGAYNGTDYWIVKNSWGGLWGDEGYLKLGRSNGTGPGVCGLALMPSYPVKVNYNPPRPPRALPDPPTPPSPPADGPVSCDSFSACMPDTTCCCLMELAGKCLQWACCPLPNATCCSDHMHCCPHTMPKCDVKHSRCLKSEADAALENVADSVPWSLKVPAISTKMASDTGTIRTG